MKVAAFTEIARPRQNARKCARHDARRPKLLDTVVFPRRSPYGIDPRPADPEPPTMRHAVPAALPAVLLALTGSSGLASDAHALAAALRADAAMDAAAGATRVEPVPLTASLLLQTRYMFNSRDDSRPPNFQNYTQGFDMPRAELRLQSNIFNKQLTGYLAFDFGDAEGDRGRGQNPSLPAGNGSPQLREAYAQYNFEGSAEGFYLKVGQFKSIFNTEDAIAPEYQLAVARSVTNEFFNLGLTQGIAVGRVRDRVAWEVALTDGAHFWGNPEPANTAFNSGLEADVALTYRFDWKFAGDWSRFADFSSWRGSDEAFRVGFGLHMQTQGQTNPSEIQPDFFNGTAPNVNMLAWTVDAQYESDGWAAFAAYHGHRIDYGYRPLGLITIQHGFVLQGSYFFDDRTEGFARVDWLTIDNEITNGFGTTQGDFLFLTAGVNYFPIPESHAIKLSFDATYAPNDSDTLDIGAFGGNSAFFPDPTVTGLLGGASGELVFRGQFQVLF